MVWPTHDHCRSRFKCRFVDRHILYSQIVDRVNMTSSASNGMGGGCRCGRLRYQISVDSVPNAYACHCRDCQTWSGSAFSLQCLVAETSFTCAGEAALREQISDDGLRLSRQYACPDCFTRVYNTNSARPGLVVVRAGTLDCSDDVKIVAHIWTCRKMDGIAIPENVLSWPAAGVAADLNAALSTKV